MLQTLRIHAVHPRLSLHLGGSFAVAVSALAALAVPRRRHAKSVRLDVTNAPSRLAGPPRQGPGPDSPLDPGATGEAAVPLAMSEPVGGGADKGEEPQDGVGEVDPDGVLHALDAAVALGVLIDVHLAEDAEQRDPQDEEHQVPRPHEPEAQDEGYQVQHSREGGQAADHLCVDPFAVDICALLVGAAQVDAVQRADGDSEGELQNVDGGEDDVGEPG